THRRRSPEGRKPWRLRVSPRQRLSACSSPRKTFRARAQDYPTRPITLIAPWPAGGASDTLFRILGPKPSDPLGKPVIIENRAGAASVIGTAAVAKAQPDGYTLVMGGGTALAVAVTVYKRLGYDPTKDFVPIALISRIPFVLVAHPSLP